MEPLFWIEAAGSNPHYSAAYPRLNKFEFQKDEKKSIIKREKSYSRLYGELVTFSSTSSSKKGLDEFGSQMWSLGPKYQSLPISIPSCDLYLKSGRQFINFNIHMARLLTTCRTYHEFESLHKSLLDAFFNMKHIIPKLPRHFMHFDSVDQIEKHRQELENYLYELCRIKVIAESDHVQDFLSASIRSALLEDCDDEEGIKLSERVFLKFPGGASDDSGDDDIVGSVDGVGKERKLDVLDTMLEFAKAKGSSRSYLG